VELCFGHLDLIFLHIGSDAELRYQCSLTSASCGDVPPRSVMAPLTSPRIARSFFASLLPLVRQRRIAFAILRARDEHPPGDDLLLHGARRCPRICTPSRVHDLLMQFGSGVKAKRGVLRLCENSVLRNTGTPDLKQRFASPKQYLRWLNRSFGRPKECSR
jgi:hypothetical protein